MYKRSCSKVGKSIRTIRQNAALSMQIVFETHDALVHKRHTLPLVRSQPFADKFGHDDILRRVFLEWCRSVHDNFFFNAEFVVTQYFGSVC